MKLPPIKPAIPLGIFISLILWGLSFMVVLWICSYVGGDIERFPASRPLTIRPSVAVPETDVVQYEENPCGGLIQQARISARDRAARERADKEKGGGL